VNATERQWNALHPAQLDVERGDVLVYKPGFAFAKALLRKQLTHPLFVGSFAANTLRLVLFDETQEVASWADFSTGR
jgi:hypothetical protein